jgi:hypothetical protein
MRKSFGLLCQPLLDTGSLSYLSFEAFVFARSALHGVADLNELEAIRITTRLPQKRSRVCQPPWLADLSS